MANQAPAAVMVEELDTVILDRLRNQSEKAYYYECDVQKLIRSGDSFQHEHGAATAADAKSPGNAKPKGKQDTNAQGQHGRDAGELPFPPGNSREKLARNN